VLGKKRRDGEMHTTTVNGEPGSCSPVAEPSSTSCRCESREAVSITLNPDKLSRWSVAEID
jgi:hypothetical protein